MIRAPLAPIGWPRAVAPPWTLILSWGMPRSCIAIMATQAKASLTSNRSTSPTRPAGLVERLAHRADRGGGEHAPAHGRGAAWATMRATGLRPSRSATLWRVITIAAAPSEIERGVGGGDRAVLGEGGLQRRDLGGVALGRLLVLVDQSSGPCGRRSRPATISRANAPRRLRLLGAGQRGDRVFVLRLAGELIVVGGVLGEAAHQPALLIGVLEAVEEHVVDKSCRGRCGRRRGAWCRR